MNLDTKAWLELNERFPFGESAFDSLSVYKWIENRFLVFKHSEYFGMC